MAEPIIPPTVVHGQLLFFAGNVAVSDLRTALCAWSAIEALVNRRQACLSIMRASVGNEATFNRASQEEAELAARIRRLRHATRQPRDQYRQDIWDSFPHLQKPDVAGGAS